MPRGKRPTAAGTGPSDDDFAAFRAALGPAIQAMGAPTLPAAKWAALTKLVIEKGYSLVISPTLGGRAYKIALPMGEKRVEVFVSAQETAEQVIESLLLAAQQLSARE